MRFSVPLFSHFGTKRSEESLTVVTYCTTSTLCCRSSCVRAYSPERELSLAGGKFILQFHANNIVNRIAATGVSLAPLASRNNNWSVVVAGLIVVFLVYIDTKAPNYLLNFSFHFSAFASDISYVPLRLAP